MAAIIPNHIRQVVQEVRIPRDTFEGVRDLLDPSEAVARLHLLRTDGGEGWCWLLGGSAINVRASQWIQMRNPDVWAGDVKGSVVYLSADELRAIPGDVRVRMTIAPPSIEGMVADVPAHQPPKPPTIPQVPETEALDDLVANRKTR